MIVFVLFHWVTSSTKIQNGTMCIECVCIVSPGQTHSLHIVTLWNNVDYMTPVIRYVSTLDKVHKLCVSLSYV